MDRENPLILVVDDETHILHVVSLKLTRAGYDVITAEDGEEALEMALEELPDVVITDFQMPIMTGLELCIQMRQHETTANTPALMLTARGFGLDDDQLRQTNIVDVLSKPFSPREVLSRVEKLLSKNSGVSITS
ncbi:MAG TPA: response regulator [Phycisphaerales bacterium]|nr:response regulator [Phycisphaerales bacterium]HCD32174.1 response regulator [Phycisphaerales bacterium]|tara:strand:+ start:2071 stop:2472 length:402 start_codon:yes stop_codon:yes gene_type:complete